jgi:glutathione synthase/RimK-type ligase-like ATP-grasp enzyme
MRNPDVVFYSDMDFEVVKCLEEEGAEVSLFNLEEIYFQMTKEGGVEIFVKDQKMIIDGFLSYGYMSKFHFEAYTYVNNGMEQAGIPCLHTPELEKVLNNKFLQGLRYAKAGVSIPPTHMGYALDSFKEIVKANYPTHSIIKKLDEYGGDGVVKCHTKEHLLDNAAKSLWKLDYCIFQKFVPDSLGKSIRAFCIDGKCVAVAQFEDKTSNFRSNNSFGHDNFSLNSFMDHKDFDKYAKLGESAVRAIGDIVLGGVDILDSEENGCVVLEVNGWPEIYDLERVTEQPLFKMFAKAYLGRVQRSKELKLKKNN